MTARLLFILASVATAMSAQAQSGGAELFKTHCSACHGEDGAGVPGLAPPLAGALQQHLSARGAANYFSQLVVSGMSGQIRAGGQILNGVMPSMAALSSEELAQILAYVTSRLNQAPEGFAITSADIDKARASKASGSEVRAMRKSLLKE